MKKFIFTLLTLASFTAQSQNLILNPSAELPLVNGEIPNWTETLGTSWIRYDNLAEFGFEANTMPDGTFWFYAQSGTQVLNGLNVSELEQTISIASDAAAIDSGTKNYYFNGYARTFEQGTNDQSNVFIQFFDDNNTLLTAYNFGPFDVATSWTNANGVLLAPVNSRTIKIKLHSVRRTGSANDAVYDNLSISSTPNLSLSENKITKNDIRIFPNPSNGVFTIQSATDVQNIETTVFDLNGRLVNQTKFDNFENKTLELTNLNKGFYILNIAKEGINYSQKIVIE